MLAKFPAGVSENRRNAEVLTILVDTRMDRGFTGNRPKFRE